MTKGIRIVLSGALLLIFVVAAHAQTSPEQAASDLRAQLTDVEAKQSALEERSRQLDEALKPENIERSLQLTGSTRPEELREQRRRELAKEKESVRLQLDQLATSRTRLEAAIATADAEAYRRSALTAGPAAATPVNSTSALPARAVQEQQSQPQRRRYSRRNNRRSRPHRHKT